MCLIRLFLHTEQILKSATLCPNAPIFQFSASFFLWTYQLVNNEHYWRKVSCLYQLQPFQTCHMEQRRVSLCCPSPQCLSASWPHSQKLSLGYFKFSHIDLLFGVSGVQHIRWHCSDWSECRETSQQQMEVSGRWLQLGFTSAMLFEGFRGPEGLVKSEK